MNIHERIGGNILAIIITVSNQKGGVGKPLPYRVGWQEYLPGQAGAGD